MMNSVVKIVIPFYKINLKSWERVSLDNTMKVLSAHPIVFLKPFGLDISEFAMVYPQAEVMEVSSEWLGMKNGIAGYNEMMMSKDFYDLFADTKYIFICHLDAWVFRDDLLDWCRRGYDLVAAPWPTRPRYTCFPLKQYLWLRSCFISPNRMVRSKMFGKIGNGGLCLRKVATLSAACERYADEILRFNKKKGPLYNEDIFWALVPKELTYPSVEEALDFAYDLKPDVCHELHHRQLPMGCHGFMHKRRVRFWEKFIPCIGTFSVER